MSTLYDLLGALADDDAEGLRSAFRKAVKGTHPDINPGDPHAALKFRQIVRANEILSDDEQRCAYNHLLDLAYLEQELALRRAHAARIHEFAYSTVLAGFLVAMIGGGYLLSMQMPTTSVGLPWRLFQVEAVGATNLQVANDQKALPAKTSGESVPRGPNGSAAATHLANTCGAPAVLAFIGASTPSKVWGDPIYRNNDLGDAIPKLNQTIRFDPQFSAAFQPSIIFYPAKNVSGAAADVVRAKPAAKAIRAEPVPTTTGRPRIEPRPMPIYQRRTAELDLSRRGW